MIGVIRYNVDGLPICEICGGAFNRVLAHARQKHDISAREYKIKYGLDLHKGICSKESKELARKRVYENYDKCIKGNLIDNGISTRFKDGGPGRTKDKVSPQTRLALRSRLCLNINKKKEEV